MNVCVICEADGVLEALGHWYCAEHAATGLIDVACFCARLYEWDIEDTEQAITDWVYS